MLKIKFNNYDLSIWYNFNHNSTKEHSLILAFGDTITSGQGVESEFSYPKQIEKKTGLKIINAGVTNELSSEGVLRLPSLLKDKPDLVILCHGSKDIYSRLSTAKLKENLLKMIKLIEQSGSKVLLVGVPNYSILSNNTHSLYDEISKETGVLFEENVLRNIASSNFLKIDYIHPNAEGYEMMADAFIEILDLQSTSHDK